MHRVAVMVRTDLSNDGVNRIISLASTDGAVVVAGMRPSRWVPGGLDQIAKESSNDVEVWDRMLVSKHFQVRVVPA